MPKQPISMACDIESRRPTPDRKAAWHVDCVIPTSCRCPAHGQDKPGTASTVLPMGRHDPQSTDEARHLEVSEGRRLLPGRRP